MVAQMQPLLVVGLGICGLVKMPVLPMKLQIKEKVDKALQALSEQQREVIVLRFGLDGRKKQVLQEIADEYSLTRERIRQIQKKGVELLKGDKCMEELSSAINQIDTALRACGGVADEDTICAVCEVSTKAERNYIHLLLVIGGDFYLSPETDTIQKYWYVEEKNKNAIDTVLSNIHREFEKNKNNLIDKKQMEKMYTTITNLHQGNIPDFSTVMNLSRRLGTSPFGEWGMREHPEVSLSGLSGYIRSVLRDAGKPLHFREISERVSKLREDGFCNVFSCHNELVRRKEFILVGRGLYALEDMGYRPGTIVDIITMGIKERGPMTKQEIVDFVKNERYVKTQSIILTLGKKDLFRKGQDNKYFLVV